MGKFGERAHEALRRRADLRILYSGAVSAHVDRVHHCECAANAEEESKEPADRD